MSTIFFSPGDRHTNGLLDLFYLCLEGITDPKRRFVSFNVIPSNDRVFCVYTISGHNTWEQLAREHFFEGLQNYMENKSDENENKIIFGDFNSAIDKMDKDGRNETQRLYRCGSNYALSKFWIMGSRIHGKGRTQIPLTSPTAIDPLAQDPGYTWSIVIYKLIAIS